MSANATLVQSWRAAWNRFFFAQETPYGLALARIVLPWIMFGDMAWRWPMVREIYSSDGAPCPLHDNFGWPGFLPEFPAPLAVALHTAMLFLFVTSSLGWCTRISLLGSVILYFYFGYMDCISTVTKYTVIATHVMFLLGFSPCGEIWSVDAWLRRRTMPQPVPPTFAVWPQRLIQILLAMVYFGAAVTKLHTPQFFRGDQLMYWMITYIANDHPLGDLLAQFPFLLMIFAYITVVWEIIFPFTIWQKWARVPMLAIGATFHVMTAFTLGLYIFPMVILASYCAFLTENDVHLLRRVLRVRAWGPAVAGAISRVWGLVPAWPLRSQWSMRAAFAVLIVLCTLGGVKAEQMLDLYHTRDGMLPLQELTEEEVQHLLGPEEPLRESDKFHAVDVGMTTVGEYLVDRRSEFTQGQRAVVQVTLNPPHEDLWVECLVMDDEGRILLRSGQIVQRENFRATFSYMLDSAFTPGQYTFQIRSGGQNVMKKTVTLKAK